MKKIAVIILVLVFCISSSLGYLFYGGGLDKYYPVVGESVKQVRNGFYSLFGISVEAKNSLQVRQGIEFGTYNEGLAQVSLLDGQVLVTLLGNSHLTVSDTAPFKPAPALNGETSPGNDFMPGLDDPSHQAAVIVNSNELDQLVLSDFTGIAFIEMRSPVMRIRFDGAGVIGNGLRLRLRPAPNSDINPDVVKELKVPVSVLLFKPEKRRGLESIICLNLPESMNLEVWLNEHRGYAMGMQTQFSFNRTPGTMETSLLSEADSKKLVRWLQVEGVWSGESPAVSIGIETRQAVRKVLDASLTAVSASLSANTLDSLKALIYEWSMLGWISINNKADDVADTPQPVMMLERTDATSAAPVAPELNGDNQTAPAPVQEAPEAPEGATDMPEATAPVVPAAPESSTR